MSLCQRPIESNRLPQQFNGSNFARVAVPSFAPQQHAPVRLIEKRFAREPLDRLLQTLLSFARSTLVKLSRSQPGDSLGIRGVQFHRPLVKRFSVVDPP